MKPRSAGYRRHLTSSPFNDDEAVPPVERYSVQDRVSHDRYGLGRVTEVQGESAVVVEFGSLRVRVTAPYAKLTKL
jgi:hypothetical protein